MMAVRNSLIPAVSIRNALKEIRMFDHQMYTSQVVGLTQLYVNTLSYCYYKDKSFIRNTSMYL